MDALTKIELQEELLKIRERFHNTMIMVTHDIEEAVFLADRIVVMSARPGRIKDVIEVELGNTVIVVVAILHTTKRKFSIILRRKDRCTGVQHLKRKSTQMDLHICFL